MNDCEENDDILKKREKLDFYMNLVRKYWHKRPEFDLADSAELVSDVPRKTGDEYRAAYELGMKTAFDKALFESDCTFGFVDGLLDGLYLLSVRLEEEVIRRNEEIEAEELAREEKAAEIIEKLEERLHESGGNSEIEDMLQDAYDGYFGNNRPFKETDQSIYFSMDWKRISPSEEIREAIGCVAKEKKFSKAERVPEFEPVPDDLGSVLGDLGSVPGERFEDGTPASKENGEGSGNAETNEGSGRNAASPLGEDKNPPRREGGENGVPEKGGRTGTPHAEADTGNSSQTGGGVKPVEGNKEEQGGTKPKFVPDTSKTIPDSGAPMPPSPEQNGRQAAYEEGRRAAKQEEQRRNLESLEPGASTKKTVPIRARRKITSEVLVPIVKKLKRLIEKGGKVSEEEAKKFVAEVEKVVGSVADKYGVSDEKGELKLKELRLAVKKLLDAANGKSGFDPVEAFNMLKPLADWSVKLNKKRATPKSSKNAEKIAKNAESRSVKSSNPKPRPLRFPGSHSNCAKPVDSYGSKFW